MPQLRETDMPQYCVALYDNVADSFDELSFKTGDVLLLVEQESVGHEGWIVCSIKGKKGICPRNRLRMLTEIEQDTIRENKRLVTKSIEQSYLYDMPQPIGLQDNLQYDVPQLSIQSLTVGESYDVPKPVGGAGSLTPSSSVSSLTTDSNRSSLIQQDYDIPRPARPHINPQCLYDVPKGGGEMLEMNSALEWLGRLESDVTSGISGLVGVATIGWRSRANLEPRLSELRWSVSRLSSSLHDLTLFCQSVRAAHHDKGLGGKLGPLVASLTKADLLVKECCQSLEFSGWSTTLLAVEDPDIHQPDALDALVSCAAALTDDIRQVTSFIQGNATLLFKKNAPTGQESVYINLEDKSTREKDVIVKILESSNKEEQIQEPLSENDKTVLDFYSAIILQHVGLLMQEIQLLLSTVTQNRPPKVFLLQAKCVVTSCQRVIQLADTVERSLCSPAIKRDIEFSTQRLCEAMNTVGHKTRTAAVHFPSVSAVQFMVNSVDDLADSASRLRQAILVH
ncbi:serine_rich_CAS and FAT-like_CAS_C domain-containing protein p130CAS [Rhodnius prolixus]|uniref:SH3 domain-containing protein n=1 Tax=Rhodnius prolixus TaxID=13249 RepID=T1I2D8_RHOPR